MIRSRLFSTPWVAFLSLLLTTAIHAGDRSLSAFGATNATRGDEPVISKRLFELFVKDAEHVLMEKNEHGFGWRDGGTVKLVSCPDGLFKPMIIPSNKRAVANLIGKHKISDGLLVYEYGAGLKKARLKLFDSNGGERILIKLPLEPDGPMKDSLLRDTRRKAMVAIGGALHFVP
jgi:hypothetical protein